jgi:hypothetical protein
MSIEQEVNKRNFVEEQLNWWSDYVADLVIRALIRRKINITADLVNSVRGQAQNDVGQLIFTTYGRMVDMGAGRGYRKGIQSLSHTRETLMLGRNAGRKPKKFYSPIAYGTLNRLIQRIVSEYQESIIYGLKKPLES